MNISVSTLLLGEGSTTEFLIRIEKAVAYQNSRLYIDRDAKYDF